MERFARGCHLDPPRLETLFLGFHLGELCTNQRPKLVLIFEELMIVEELLIADEHVGEFLQSFKSRRAPPWLNGSTSTMRDWGSWVQFPWLTSTFNVDIARIFVFYLAMVRNCCGLLWRQGGGCSYLPYTMSAKAVRWVSLDRDRCTLYEINKSMFMFK